MSKWESPLTDERQRETKGVRQRETKGDRRRQKETEGD